MGRGDNGDRSTGSSHPGLRSALLAAALKVVLGLLGFMGFALLGAGGALLVKHRLHGAPRPTASVAASAPVVIPAPAAVTAAPVLPSSPVLPVTVTPPGPGSAKATAAAPGQVPAGPPVLTRAEARRLRREAAAATATPEVGSPSADGARAQCLARLDALNADLSLNNEPPTPQQIAILKRGCK